MTFTGLDADRVSFGYQSQLEFVSDFSVSFWFKSDGYVASGASAWNGMLSKGQISTGLTEFYGFFVSNNDSIAFMVNQDTNRVSTGSGGSSPCDGEWHHLVGYRSGNDIFLYLDNVYVGTNTTSGTGVSGSDPFWIGRDTLVSRYYTGELSDVRIYNRALTTTEITSLYNLYN